MFQNIHAKDNYSGVISLYLWGTLRVLLTTPIITATADCIGLQILDSYSWTYENFNREKISIQFDAENLIHTFSKFKAKNLHFK